MKKAKYVANTFVTKPSVPIFRYMDRCLYFTFVMNRVNNDGQMHVYETDYIMFPYYNILPYFLTEHCNTYQHGNQILIFLITVLEMSFPVIHQIWHHLSPNSNVRFPTEYDIV